MKFPNFSRSALNQLLEHYQTYKIKEELNLFTPEEKNKWNDYEHLLAAYIVPLKEAQKFTMQNIDIILDTDISSVSFDKLHLPYSRIIIEYNVDSSKKYFKMDSPGQTVSAPKRIIILEEIDEEHNKRYYKEHILDEEKIDGDHILVMKSIFYNEDHKSWNLCPTFLKLTPEVIKTISQFTNDKPTNVSIPENAFIGYVKHNSQEIIRDLLPEAYTALHYLHIADTNNVYIEEKKQTLKNKTLSKKMKSKPYDSYHVLKIKPSKNKKPHQGGAHTSPRTHSRRGHIRKLATGNTTWVRPCMVGAGATVIKDYIL